MNHCTFMGNLTRDPELKSIGSGTQVCETSIAVNKKWKDKNSGEMREKVAFIDVTWWGRTAENVAQYFKKGNRILVEGELDQDTWTDKTTGQKRSKLKVQGSRFHFLPRGDRSGNDSSNQSRGQSSAGEENQDSSYYSPPSGDAGDHGDVPF
jgi:single-strand DNA-binding protein